MEIFGVDPVYSANHKDYRIPEKESESLKEDYFASIEYSKDAHRLLATLGGKAPHTHGVFTGGVTVAMNAQKILDAQGLSMKSSIFKISIIFITRGAKLKSFHYSILSIIRQ